MSKVTKHGIKLQAINFASYLSSIYNDIALRVLKGLLMNQKYCIGYCIADMGISESSSWQILLKSLSDTVEWSWYDSLWKKVCK